MYTIRINLSPEQLNLLCDILGVAQELHHLFPDGAVTALAQHIEREVNTVHEDNPLT